MEKMKALFANKPQQPKKEHAWVAHRDDWVINAKRSDWIARQKKDNSPTTNR